jgi:sulfite exporter TauE/SafE
MLAVAANAHADMASSVASLLALATGAIRRMFAISVVGNLCQRQFSKKTFRFSNRLVANVQSYCVSVGNI